MPPDSHAKRVTLGRTLGTNVEVDLLRFSADQRQRRFGERALALPIERERSLQAEAGVGRVVERVVELDGSRVRRVARPRAVVMAEQGREILGGGAVAGSHRPG